MDTKRPKSNEEDEDLLRMQENFKKSQQRPSVQVAPKSKFVQRKEAEKKEKGISTSTDVGETPEPSSSVKEPFDAINNIPTATSSIILGNIVEHKFDSAQIKKFKKKAASKSQFPSVSIPKDVKTDKPKSLFLQELEDQGNMEVESSWSEDIHKSNLQKLSEMKPEEILAAKADLEKTLKLETLEFLKSRRKRDHEVKSSSASKSRKIDEAEKMEIDENPKEMPEPLQKIYKEAKEKGWVNMNAPEPEKLEWAEQLPVTAENEQSLEREYNARFNFDGVLMPYKDDSVTVDQGLHHHGDEPGRPGYSLQELIQLSRSENQQQRCAALSTLANIISKTRTGIYDKVLHPAPLAALNEKHVFVLLRFSLDSNAMPVITSTLHALKEFLVSEADEFCLDRLFGLIDDYEEPTLIPQLEDGENFTDIKDEELGQLDIVALAIRSNIMERIRYILSWTLLPSAAVNAALNILIRLARRSREITLKIAALPGLLDAIVENFVPCSINKLMNPELKNNAHGVPIVAALRLCRVLIIYAGKAVAGKLQTLKIVNSLVLYVGSDIGEKGLDLKIESLRLWKLLLSHGIALDSVAGVSSMLYTQLELLASNHDLNRATEKACEEAGALVSVAGFDNHLRANLSKLLKKWSTQLEKLEKPTWARTKLVAQTIVALGDSSAMETKWTANSKIFHSLRSSSNLLSASSLSTERDPTSLPSLGVLMENGELQPAISRDSVMPFLSITLNYLLKSTDSKNDVILAILKNLSPYIRDLAKFEWSLERSWYTRPELFFLSKVVQAAKSLGTRISDNDDIWKLALKLVSAMPGDRPEEAKAALDYAFSHEKFRTELISGQLGDLGIEQSLGFALPSDFCKRYEAFLSTNGSWSDAAMPKDWLYLPIVNVYSRIMDAKTDKKNSEEDAVNVKVLLSLESTVPQLVAQLSPNIRFSRLCLVFMCDDVYCDDSVTPLLVRAFSGFLKSHYKKLDFSASVPGLNSFTDLFIALCENFVAHSFGNDHFAMVLLTFAAQRHDVHYRKSLWSEHAGALRYLAISPENLYFPLAELLYPLETDVSQIECYITALVRKTVRSTWCPVAHIIATHHAAMFLKQDTKVARRMRDAVEALKDRQLAEMLLNYQSPM